MNILFTVLSYSVKLRLWSTSLNYISIPAKSHGYNQEKYILCERRGRTRMGPGGLKAELILNVEGVVCDDVHCGDLLP